MLLLLLFRAAFLDPGCPRFSVWSRCLLDFTAVSLTGRLHHPHMNHKITPTQPPAHSILLEAGRVPSVSPSLLSQGPREEDTKPKSFLKNASGLLQAASDDSSPGQQGMQMTLRGLSSGIRHRCEGVAMASEARERSVWPFCLPMPGHRDTEQGKWWGWGAARLPRRAGLNGWSSEGLGVVSTPGTAPQLASSISAPGADPNGPLPPAGPPPHVPVASEAAVSAVGALDSG